MKTRAAIHRSSAHMKKIKVLSGFMTCPNVREWVQDWFEEQYYQHAPLKNPKGPDSGEMKAMRGSSWNDSPLTGRTSSRMKMFPDYRDTTVGFRCAKSVD